MQKDFQAIEDRASALRVTMAEVCAGAGMNYSTWWRWSTGKTKPNMSSLRAIENHLKELEAAK